MDTGLQPCIKDDGCVITTEMQLHVKQEQNLFQRLTNNWKYRAQVKKDELDETLLLDDDKDDFIVELLPFKDHRYFIEASDEMCRQILTCGWLAYNEKTVDIETKIITPACMRIIYGEISGLQDSMSSYIASQTLVDEAYHILLVNRASQLTRERRGLHSIAIPESALITKMRNCKQQYSEEWQHIIIEIVTAIVSEVFISDYLRLLSNETTIQPLNRLIVDIHRRDELAHSSIFKNITKCIYASLDTEKRKFFMEMLPKPVHWFANLELDVWDAMLRQIGFPHAHELIHDCKSINEQNLMKLDYSALIALAEELEYGDTHVGMDSFYREGLIT